jgi:formylglycine-generating enzyme required for sulfatase activity
MVNIRAGTFSMGSNDDASEKPPRQVTVKAFAISRYPVTVREWKACVAAQGCRYQAAGDEDSPVRNVSYNDAQEYVNCCPRSPASRIACQVKPSGNTPRVPVRRRRTGGVAR